MSKSISVYFPQLNGGEEVGFNDAGVEQFKHDRIESLMRECTQNSTDALDKTTNSKTVRMEFKLLDIPIAELPGLTELKIHLKSCLDYVSVKEVEDNERKSQQFFKNAVELLSKKTIPCLLIRDYNTTGLYGDDDDRNGKWFSLVRARGSSNKSSDTAGGSFGIGKSAPFACSALRTVFYSTKYKGKCALQGKSVLITHLDDKKKQTQGVGFIGITTENKNIAIREESQIPEFLKRNGNGTDILIVGFTEKDWIGKIKIAGLKHFWPALELNKVRFEIDDNKEKIVIDKSNLDSELSKISFKASEEKIPDYLATFRKGEKKNLSVKNAGGCDFSVTLSDGNQDYTNKVCCFRNNAMVIEYMNINIGGNFNGVFHCDNDTGSKIFREMEPPRHDKWTPLQPQEPDDQKRCQETYDDLRSKLREFVQELIQKNISESVDPGELEINTPADGNSDANSEESLEPVGVTFEPRKVKVIKPVPPRPVPIDPDPLPPTPDVPFKPVTPKPIPKFKYSSLRCFLKQRGTIDCLYSLRLPDNLDTQKKYSIEAFAVGYDGKVLELELDDKVLKFKTGDKFTEFIIKGEPLSIFANIIID